jgi:hypothetical protein
MKSKGQTIVIAIFVIVLIIAIASFFFYYSGTPITGESSGDKKVTIVEKVSAAENLVVPDELSITAKIGEDNREYFEVTNLNDNPVSVSCLFPALQEYVPSSNCFTYDDGQFVGEDKGISISPGKTQMFVASVMPFKDLKVTRGDKEILVDITEGTHRGEIELSAWFEGEETKTVSVITIPIKIFVED